MEHVENIDVKSNLSESDDDVSQGSHKRKEKEQ